LEITRNYQAEYDIQIASWDGDDTKQARWITERIAELRELS
jgi:hypothetical protein